MGVRKPISMVVGRGTPILGGRDLEAATHIMDITPSHLVGFSPFQVGTGVDRIEGLHFVVRRVVVSSGVVIFREETWLPTRLPRMAEHPVTSPCVEIRVSDLSSFGSHFRCAIKASGQFSHPAKPICLE